MNPNLPEDDAVVESARRIRRGCFAGALIFGALTVLFISATGNLAFSLLLIISLVLVILSRFVR